MQDDLLWRGGHRGRSREQAKSAEKDVLAEGRGAFFRQPNREEDGNIRETFDNPLMIGKVMKGKNAMNREGEGSIRNQSILHWGGSLHRAFSSLWCAW